MYELGYDLLVEEEGLQTEVETLAKKAEAFEEGLKNLESILKEIQKDAIVEGNAAKNLTVFTEEIGALKGEAAEWKEEWKSKIAAYISVMELADKLLF